MNANVSATMVSPPVKDWTHYSTGIAWGTVALFVVVVVSYLGMIAAIVAGSMSLPVATMVATVLLYLAFTVVHEAGHGNISHEVTWMKPVETTMGWMLSIPFLLIPYGLFTKIHDYHHAFTNDPDRDPDHWISGNTWAKASLRSLTLTFNYAYLAATRFRKEPVIAKTHKSTILYYLGSLTIIVGLVSAGYGLELLMVGVIPAFLASYVLGMLFDWIPHMPTRQQGRYQNTRSYLFPGLNYLTCGQSYHHIHHLYPRVSWYNYHRVFDLIRPELEVKNAPIEKLFSRKLPGFGKSLNAQEPSCVDGIHKLTLSVSSIRHETDTAVAITFDSMNGKTIAFKAGQYVTLTKWIDGEAVTRCYSICESPSSGKLSVGVKRVDQGVMSNFLNNDLKVGDELTVAGPFGDFIYEPTKVDGSRVLTLIAGGSGITPVLAIAKTALERGSEKRVHLIYANRSIADVMFSHELDKLLLAYPDRFRLTAVYELPHSGWEGLTGYLDAEKLLELLATSEQSEKGCFFICGPAIMKEIVTRTLETMDVSEQQIFVEEFGQMAPKPEGPVHKVTVALASGLAVELNVAENQTVLQAALSEGVKIPHACGVGQCGCCMMLVTQGESELALEETPGLLPGEKAQGYTLACQCRPKSELSLVEGANHG